jgi:hypothetical protein
LHGAEAVHDDIALGRGYLSKLAALTASGDFAAGAEADRLGTSVLERAGDTVGLLHLDMYAAYRHALSGELDQGMERAEQGLRRGSASGEVYYASYLRTITGLVWHVRGDADAGGRDALQALTVKKDFGDTMGAAYCLDLSGWVACAQQARGDADAGGARRRPVPGAVPAGGGKRHGAAHRIRARRR